MNLLPSPSYPQQPYSLKMSTSPSPASLNGTRRRLKPDSDNEMLRELVKTLCECLFRSRSPPRTSTTSGIPSQSPSLASQDNRPKKTKWFGIVSDRVPEVDALMGKSPRTFVPIAPYRQDLELTIPNTSGLEAPFNGHHQRLL